MRIFTTLRKMNTGGTLRFSMPKKCWNNLELTKEQYIKFRETKRINFNLIGVDLKCLVKKSLKKY